MQICGMGYLFNQMSKTDTTALVKEAADTVNCLCNM